MRRGQLTKKDFEKYLKALPDSGEKAAPPDLDEPEDDEVDSDEVEADLQASDNDNGVAG
jgi:hypothetical protein